MATWFQYGKDALSITPGNEDGFNQGELADYGQPGYADFLWKLDVTVNYTSGNTVAAMTEAQVLTWLKTFSLDVRIDTERAAKGNAKGQDPSNIFHPLQALTFDEVRLAALRLAELEVGNITSATTGPRRSYTAASDTITFTLYVPVGLIKPIREWQQLYGVGHDLLKLLRFKVRVISDGLAAYDSDLTTDSVDVVVKADRRKTPWSRAFFLPMRRQYQPGSNQRKVDTHGGVIVLDAADATAKLSSTTLTELTTEVGGEVVFDREAPSEIRAAYTAQSNVGSPENTISDYVTEVFMFDETPFDNILSGKFVATQETYEQEWDLRTTELPAPSEDQVLHLIRAIAGESLKIGEELHFVNALAAAGLIDGVPGRLLPAGGLAYLPSTDARAQEIAGLRVGKMADGKVYTTLYIPPSDLREAALKYMEAILEKSELQPTGNVAKMDGAVNKAGRSVPGMVGDEVNGFPASNGTGGAPTGIYRTVRGVVRKAAEAALSGK